MAAAPINGEERRAAVVCVTGATGFIASSLVKRLLEKGYTVHATVRDPVKLGKFRLVLFLFWEFGPANFCLTHFCNWVATENLAKVRHLLEIPEGGEKLKLFRADLLEEGSFDGAIDGCDGVFHVASPLDFDPKDPENDVIKPAVEGTLNVLRGCTKANTVKRVVVTSSAAALMEGAESKQQNELIDETNWADVDFLRTKKPPAWAYRVSKTLAEQAALQYGKENPGLDVVTINPVVVAGAAITPNVPFSVENTLSLLTGNRQSIEVLKGLQMTCGTITLVHVEDVCSAQIFLMDNPAAEGRYICCSVNTTFPQLADYLSKRYPQHNVTAQFEDMPPVPKVYVSSKKLVESGFSFKFGIDQIFDDGVEYLRTKGLLV